MTQPEREHPEFQFVEEMVLQLWRFLLAVLTAAWTAAYALLAKLLKP